MDKGTLKFFAILLSMAALILLGTTGVYVYTFGLTLPSEVSGWGTVGDFFGGILNPSFALLGLIALLATLRLNQNELQLTRDELALSREELKKSVEFSERQVIHNESQAKRDDMSRLLEKMLKEINDSLEKEFKLSSGKGYRTASWFLLRNGGVSDDLASTCLKNSDTLERCISRVASLQWNMVVALKSYYELGSVDHGYMYYKSKSSKLIRILHEQGFYKSHFPSLSPENKKYFREFAGID